MNLPVRIKGRDFRQPLFVGQPHVLQNVAAVNPPAYDRYFNFDDLIGQLNGGDNIKDKLGDGSTPANVQAEVNDQAEAWKKIWGGEPTDKSDPNYAYQQGMFEQMQQYQVQMQMQY